MAFAIVVANSQLVIVAGLMEVIVQRRPYEMFHTALNRNLEDTNAPEDFVLNAKSPAIQVNKNVFISTQSLANSMVVVLAAN